MDNKNLEKAMQDLVKAINETAKIIHEIKTEQSATVNRPEVLYAIENINTGEITFNARSGAYQDKEAAYKKMCCMGQNEHRIVEYRLEK